MTAIASIPTALGHQLDLAAEAFGAMRPTAADAPADQLRERLAQDGYLYLPGLLDRAEVLAARADVLARLAGGRGLHSEVAAASAPLQELLYADRLPELYGQIFTGPVRHFDYTWLRPVPPGGGTAPHSDSVFMNRGTSELLTAWVPLGDVDLVLGGLAVLERSHLLEDIKQEYGSRDVDAYCSNGADPAAAAASEDMLWNGWLSDDPHRLRQELGLRWLTADFRAGDVVTFPLHTVHIGLDNRSDQLRLSCDLRYQPADAPADPRWIGPHPSAHGAGSKRGLIC